MQIWNLHQICIKSASSLHHICISFFIDFVQEKHQKYVQQSLMYRSFQKYKDSTPKPDVQKFSKVQGFNTKAWCTEVFKSIWIQHQSLMYRSFQKYMDSTPKLDVHKFSKVHGFNTKAWCTEVIKSTRFPQQSLMYRSSQKYKVSAPKPDVQKFSKVQGFHNKAWCTEVLKSTRSQHQSLMYRSSQKYQVSTPKPDVYLWVVNVMFLWDLHVFVLVTWNVWCTFEICMSLYLWLRMNDTHWSLHTHLTLCDL